MSTEQTPAPTADPATERTGRLDGLKDLAGRLYRGEAGLDVVGLRRISYVVVGAILLIAVLSFSLRGFTLGIEFQGGRSFTFPASVGTLDEARSAVQRAGVEVVTAQRIGGTGGSSSYQVKTDELDERQAVKVRQDIATDFRIPVDQISESAVSGSWGSHITWKALQGSLIFLVLVAAYLAVVLREWKMAVAALASLAVNLLLTATVYSLVGFEVTPSTIIGFLTILGFALYDVVVVFDKVQENTRGITGSTTRTFGEAANLAVNQVLMRSINTSVVALLPVGGLLFIGAGLLGAGTLKEIGLVLFVGMLAATTSSIFFATPVLVDLKEQEPRFKQHKQRVLARRAAGIAGERRPARTTTRPAAPARAATASGQVRAGAGGPDDGLDREAVAAAAPRAGARPQPAKRSGARSGGPKSGGRSGGSKSGGGRRGSKRR